MAGEEIKTFNVTSGCGAVIVEHSLSSSMDGGKPAAVTSNLVLTE